ncbi:CDP-glycerol glycerophosphotransferase family protein [Helicobacter ibis]|uniref:CDP-glycerol glycerophosphotransferase family protein n=1 Tax=Helicobacter ibis TaxID=2962633 RepID=A0ABT4VEY0_9HELI|nr:CDP-glycerol glycerophosphotransferase family protein [Helicobacter ibis]MDA3969259.1 CDP-glycerol glycerophosphotransferase family protein [Helicobacter ibis]
MKTIIISPHHTITNWEGLRLSNFLEFSDFFLELPKLYPQIHFIFRPHPLLFDTIKQNPNLWNDSVESYLTKISRIPNMTYDDTSDYLQTFMDSSALIHDCGSFLAEYLFTEKPMLFIAKRAQANDSFTKHGKDLLDKLYLAYTQEEIINFINEVVINNNDYMKKKRVNFTNKQIIYNQGNAGKAIANDIIREIFG